MDFFGSWELLRSGKFGFALYSTTPGGAEAAAARAGIQPVHFFSSRCSLVVLKQAALLLLLLPLLLLLLLFFVLCFPPAALLGFL